MPYSNQKMPSSDDVKTLLDSVAPFGCSLHHFETMPDLRGGCWVLIIRQESVLIKFFWDGRDDLLTVEETDFDATAKQYLWHSTVVPRVDVDDVHEPFRYIEEVLKMKYRPNKSPEPAAVGAVSSAVAVHVASRRWLSFFR